MQVQYIVHEAIYESLQDRALQPAIDAGYAATALDKLNRLLDRWRDKVPFAIEYTFNNVSDLTNTQFTSVSNVNYILPQNNQSPLRRVTLDEWNNLQTVIGLQGTPQIYYFDELKQSILVYPTPNQPAYQFTVWGRYATQPLALFDTVPPNITFFMVDALIYELAYMLCGSYGVYWDPIKEETRQTQQKYLDSKRSIDVSAPITNVFGQPSGGVPGYPWLWAISGGY